MAFFIILGAIVILGFGVVMEIWIYIGIFGDMFFPFKGK